MSDAIARGAVSAARKIGEGDYSSDRYRGSVLSRRFMLRYVVQMIDRETNRVVTQCPVAGLTRRVDVDSVMAQAKRSKGEGMDGQEFRVGQKVRVEDVQEGIVTGVDDGVIYVAGNARMTDGSPYDGMTRTITILSEPKPDEPTGLGAVVLDAAGEVWVLAEPGESGPWRRLGLEVSVWRDWAYIDAVEVLFPGVES